jgi:hypothetical protein
MITGPKNRSHSKTAPVGLAFEFQRRSKLFAVANK